MGRTRDVGPRTTVQWCALSAPHRSCLPGRDVGTRDRKSTKEGVRNCLSTSTNAKNAKTYFLNYERWLNARDRSRVRIAVATVRSCSARLQKAAGQDPRREPARCRAAVVVHAQARLEASRIVRGVTAVLRSRALSQGKKARRFSDRPLFLCAQPGG